jgi:hypothetical protein
LLERALNKIDNMAKALENISFSTVFLCLLLVIPVHFFICSFYM